MDNEHLNTSGLREELNNNMRHVLLPVIIFIGVEQFFAFFGNILVLTVYSARYKRTNFRYFVLAMAGVDLTSCCTTLPGEIFSYLNWYNYHYGWICKVKSYFNVFTAWGSASVLLILAVDRYRKICRPLRRQIQPACALKLCVCALTLSLIVSIPVAIFWGKQEYIYEHNGYNITVSICEKAGEYAETIYPLVYIGIVYFLPVGSMIFVAGTLNLLTARTLFGLKSVKAQAAEMDSRPSVVSTTLTSVSSVSDDSNSYCGQTNSDAGYSDRKSVKAQTAEMAPRPSVTSMTSTSVSLVSNDSASYCGKNNYEAGSLTSDQKIVKAQTAEMTPRPSLASSTLTSVSGDSSAGYSGKEQNNAGSPDRTGGNSFTLDNVRVAHPENNKHKHTTQPGFFRKRKTIMMLVLTSVFLVTMAVYVILVSLVAQPHSILQEMSNPTKVTYFFFLRLYFINCVVNPILYGFMDPRFRSGLLSYVHKKYKGKLIIHKPNLSNSSH